MATVREISTYESALDYLYGRINYERAAPPPYRMQNFKLERMRYLMRRLADPHDQLKIVHIAGTKGKGSTSWMLASILQSAGYRTGLYTSPHLERTEERLVVDGQCCQASDFVSVLNEVRGAVDAMDAQALVSQGPGAPTYFEIMTAMALVYFARCKVDAVVLEVGLGGRLDSTNVVSPIVTAITSISFDHMRQLGTTLAAIAGEKAGIIKPRIPIVTGVVDEEPLDVITATARKQEAPLARVGEAFCFSYQPLHDEVAPDKLPRGTVNYRGVASGQTLELSDLRLGLLGEHQAANAAVALALVQQLQLQGWQITERAIRAGLSNVRCAARAEVLHAHPTVIIDTAHNPASINALVRLLSRSAGFAKRHLVFACSKDKEAEAMLAILRPHFDQVWLTRFLNNPRAFSPAELAAMAERAFAGEEHDRPRISTAEDPQSAWHEALDSSGKDDLICVTGSFFLAAELRSVIVADVSQRRGEEA